MKKIIVLSFFVCMTGCSIAPYTPPKDGKTAKIEYLVKTKEYGGFALLFFEDKNCTSPKAIVDGKDAPIGSSTLLSGVNIPAGKPVRLMPAIISNSPVLLSTCTVPFEFLPKEDTSYTVEFIVDHTSCGVTLKYWTSDGLLIEPSFKALKYKQPFSTSGPYCEK